ncbi:MAG TPA: hypothetical protein VFW75_01270 [Acetobacteraceae bacterium]|nr:hypothetical protein [Acetobacteraceae bacterium]
MAARPAISVLVVAVLVGCHAPPPPPPRKPPPPLPPAAVHRVPEAVGASWSFAITATACVAHASNRDVSLAIRVGPHDSAELSVTGTAVRAVASRAGRSARLRFVGATGSWRLAARTNSAHAVAAAMPLAATAASHVLLLLGGGSLHTEIGKARVPVLRLPDSDVSGRDWFDCVRRKLGDAHPEG